MIGVLDSEGDQVFDIASTGGMRYDSNYANNISEIRKFTRAH